ncbi:MAG: CHASE2 domain-containing protein [Chthoniobacteraceae bacterium]|nr:CHASE2 domain-containing protein [Chthoniobacteraceae bacterium]
MRCSSRQFLFLILLAGLVLMHESRTASLRRVEDAFQTWLTANAARHATPAPLALVQIADEDLAAHPWPWTPVDGSLFLNAALMFEPRVVAVEPVLAWKEADSSQAALFHNQLLRAPKALLGAEFGFPEDAALLPPLQEVPVLRHVTGDVSRVPDFSVIGAQPGEDLRAAASLGFFAPPDGSRPGALRRVPLVFRYRGLVTPSFVLQAAMLWYGVTPEEVEVVPGSHIALGKALRIPVDAAGTMVVDFGVPFTRFPVSDLILAAEQAQSGLAKAEALAPVGVLKDGLALLARTDKESRTLPLANKRRGSRGELAAAAIATLQAGAFPVRAGVPVEAAIIVAAGLLGWLCNRRSKLAAAALCTGALCIYLLGALGVFSACQVALPLLLPVGLLLFLLFYRQLE